MSLARRRQAAWVASYFLGIAFLLTLPPWEGYDEIAHYSYAQQLGDTGDIPRPSDGRLSHDVEAYLAEAPAPYSTTPPFDENGGLTYRQWFVGTHSYERPHAPSARPRQFDPGEAGNWQAQHPWGYYALLAPFVELTAGLSWTAQLLLLRLLSWSLAFAGVVISVEATGRFVRRQWPAREAGFWWIALIWPLIFPGFFPEFARIGNDALVVLVLALVWALALRRPEGIPGMGWHLSLGALLGFGGLVKVTFLPVSAALLAWLSWLALRAKPGEGGRALGGLVLVGVVFLVCVAPWYLGNLLEQGSLTGLVELSGTQGASWLAALSRPVEIARGVTGMLLTFVWGGTASSAYPPVALVLPLVVPPLVLLACALRLLGEPRREVSLLAWLLLAMVGGGLFYYLLVRIAATGIGAGAPGWYMHILVAPLSLLIGAGWSILSDRLPRTAAWLGRLWVLYAAALVIALVWLQAALFSGCAFKTAERRIYTFDNPACLLDIPLMYERLALLAYPLAAGLCLLLALAVLLVAWLGHSRR